MARRTRDEGGDTAASKVVALPIDGRARKASRITLAFLLVLLSLWMARDFLLPIGWAVLIGVTTWPIYIRFAKFIPGNRDSVYAPTIFTLLVGLVLFLPVGLAAHRASQERQTITQSLNHYRENGIPEPEWLSRVPALGGQASSWWRANLTDAKVAPEWIGAPNTQNNDAAMSRAVGAEVLHRFFFVVSLIALFNLLRHGAWMANRFWTPRIAYLATLESASQVK